MDIALNVAVEMNLAAFAWGRASVAVPDVVARLQAPAEAAARAQAASTAAASGVLRSPPLMTSTSCSP